MTDSKNNRLKDIREKYKSTTGTSYVRDDGKLRKSTRDIYFQYNAEKASKNLKAKIDSLMAQTQGIYNDYSSRYFDEDGNIKNQYRGDTKDALQSLAFKKTHIDTETENIIKELSLYEDYLDAEYVADIKSSLQNNRKGLKDILEAYKSDNEYFSKYKDEDDYNQKVVIPEKEYESWKTADTKALKTEINDLEGKYNSYKSLKSERDNLFSTLVSGYMRAGYTRENAESEALKSSKIANYDKELSQYGDMGGMDSTLSEKKNFYNNATRIQDGIALQEKAQNAEDFDIYSKTGGNISNPTFEDVSSHFWLPSGVKKIKNKVTYSRENYDKALDKAIKVSGNHAPDVTAYGVNPLYLEMTDEEVAIYNYYLSKEGEEKADKFLDSITESLNYRQAESTFEDVYRNNAFLEGILSASAGLDNWISGVKGLFNTDGEYVPQNTTQIMGAMAREDLGEDYGIIGQGAYDLINTTANMLPSILVGKLTGGLLAGAGYVNAAGQLTKGAASVAKLAGAATLGSSAAGNGYQEMLNLGYDKSQAQAYGTLVGVSEAGLEYLLSGISSLGGTVSGGITNKVVTKLISNVDNAIAKIAIGAGGKLVGSMVSEFGEEYLQETLNPVFKNIALKTNEDIKLYTPEALYSGILGALSAGLLEGGSTISGEVSTYKSGKDVKNTGQLSNLKKLGMSYSADTVAYKIASQVNENTDAYTIGQLLHEVGADSLSETNIADITKSLERKGIPTESAQKIAKWLDAAVQGEHFSPLQRLALKNPDIAQTFKDVIINQNSTVNQRQQAYNDVLMNIANEKTNLKANVTAQKAEAKAEKAKAKAEKKGDKNSEATENTDSKPFIPYSNEEIARRQALGEDIGISESKSIADSKNTLESKFEVNLEGEIINKKTGDTIKVTEIASIDNGKMTLKLDNGETVDANDVSFGTHDEDMVYSAVLDMGVNAAVANSLVKNFKSGEGISAERYALGIKEAYKYGSYNIPMSEISKKGFAADLSEPQRKLAYDLGRMDAAEKARKAQAEAEKSGKGSVRGKVHFSGDRLKLNAIRRESLKRMDILSEALGVEFHVFESYVDKNGKRVYKDSDGKVKSAPNGKYKNGKIYIDLNAGENGEGVMIYTVSHELVHFVKEWSPAKFKILADFLMEQYGKKGHSVNDLVQAQIDKAKRNGRDISYDEAYEEVIADSMETMLNDDKVIKKIQLLKAKDKGLVAKIKEFFSTILENFSNLLKGYPVNSEEGKLVSNMKDAIEELQTLFAEALVDASNNLQSKGQKNTTSEGDVKFCSRDNNPNDFNPSGKTLNEQLTDAYKTSDSFDQRYIYVGRFSRNFIELLKNNNVILQNYPIAMNYRDAYLSMHSKETGKYHGVGINYHNLGIEGLQEALESFKNPKHIMKSKNGNKIELALQTVDNKGNNILSIIAINTVTLNGNKMLDAHIVTSAYGRKNIENYISKAKNEGRLIEYKKEEPTQGTPQVQYEGSINANSSKGSIPQISEKSQEKLSDRDYSYDNISPSEYYENGIIYSYDFLVSQDKMDVVDLPKTGALANSKGKIDDSKVLSLGIKNALIEGTKRDNKIYVKNKYTNRELRIDNSTIKHGLDGTYNRHITNARIGSVIGTVVKNAIPINGLKNTSQSAVGTYAMVSYCRDDLNREFIAIITVEQHSGDIDSFEIYDVAHAVSGRQKRSSQVDTKSQGVNPIKAATISISDLLKIVNSTHQSILSEDVLEHLGEQKNLKGSYSDKVLFSDRDPKTAENIKKINKQLTKENLKLTEDVKRLKELVKLQSKETHGKMLKKSTVELVAKRLMTYSNAKGDVSELVGHLTDVYNYIIQGEDVSWEGIQEKSQAAVDWLMQNEYHKPIRDEHANEILRFLRTSRIALDPIQKKEVAYYYESYNNFRKKCMGRVIIANDGLPLDSAWQELSSMYPMYFDREVKSPDQPIMLMEIISRLQNTYEADEYHYYSDEMVAQDLMTKVYEGYWDVSALHTGADAKAKEINLLKAKHKESMDALRDSHKESDAKLRQEHKERISQLRTQYKEREERKIQKVTEYYQKSRKEAVDRVKETREKREAITKLQKLVLDTAKWVSYPKKDDVKCPDIIRGPYAEFLSSIDLSSKRLLSGGEPTKNDLRVSSAMDSLAKAIEKKLGAQSPETETETILDTGYLDLPVHFVENLKELSENLKKRMETDGHIVNSMTSDVVKSLTKFIRTLNHSIKEMSTLYSNMRFARVEELGGTSITFLNELGEANETNSITNFVTWDNALPYYTFKRFGVAGESIFEELMDAQDKLAYLADEIFKFKEKTWKDEEVKTWSEDTHTIQLTSGRKLTLTTADAMSIYCLSRREQGRKHLFGGGVRVLDIEKNGKKAKDSRSVLNQQDVLAIAESLSERQKQVAEAIQEFMSTVCAEWGNEISMKRFLTKEFTEKFYFPIESNDENLDTKDPKAQQSDLYRLLNISATKPLTKGANNEVIIRNVFDVFVNHSSDMAKLNAFGMALLDYMKWVNYREKFTNDEGQITVRGVRKSMVRAYGEEAKEYVLTLIRDINGRYNDNGENKFVMQMMRGAKTAMVGANLRVSLLQFTSYPRAAMVLSSKSLALGLTKKPQIEKAKKYCGIAKWKSFGFYDVNISKSIEEQIKGATNIRQKLIELSLKGAEWGDAITWGCLWNACEYEAAKTKQYKVGSEEFNQAVGKKLREVVYATQVVDSTLTRSQMMRNKSGLKQMTSAFMSEPTLSANILMDAGFQFNLEKRRTGSSKLAWQKTGKYIGKAVAVYSISQLFSSLVESILDAYRDDDDEEFKDKFGEAFKKNAVLNILPFNKVPILDEVSEGLLAAVGIGYHSSNSLYLPAISEFNTAIETWQKVINGEDGKTVYAGIYSTTKLLSYITGVSASGLMREVVTLWNNTAGVYDPYLKIRTYETSTTDKKIAEYKFDKGDTSSVKTTVTKMLDDKIKSGKTEKEAKSAVRASFTSTYKPEYMVAAKAKDYDEMNRIRKFLYATGLYGTLSELDETLRKWRTAE